MAMKSTELGFPKNAVEEVWRLELGAPIISVACTPNLSLLVAVTLGGNVYVIEPGVSITPKPAASLESYECWAVDISPDGFLVSVGGSNYNSSSKKTQGLRQCYALSGTSLELLFDGVCDFPIWSTKFSPGGSRIAYSTWGGHAIVIDITNQDAVRQIDVPNCPAGAYGVDWIDDDEFVIACAGFGLSIVGSCETKSVEIADGLFNLTMSRRARTLYVGGRGGVVYGCQLDGGESPVEVIPFSTRPVCGISTTDSGHLLFAGDFGGLLHCYATSLKQRFQTVQLSSDIWSICSSAGGRRAVVGTEAGTLHAFDVHPAEEDFEELRSIITRYERIGALDEKAAARLRITASRTGLGLFLSQSILAHSPTQSTTGLVQDILDDRLSAHPDDLETRLYKGNTIVYKGNTIERSRQRFAHFQRAAESSRALPESMKALAEVFEHDNFNVAAGSAIRRAKAPHLETPRLLAMYNLALNLEDIAPQLAARLYEVIFSFDVHFRDVYEKLKSRKTKSSPAEMRDEEARLENTRTALFWQDPRLKWVQEAREKEDQLGFDRRKMLIEVLKTLRNNETFSRTIRPSSLDYDHGAIMAYEFGQPTDEIKKALEAVTLLTNVSEFQSLPEGASSFDFGTASARYPLLLSSLGMTYAAGIDKANGAVQYARNKIARAIDDGYLGTDDAELNIREAVEIFHGDFLEAGKDTTQRWGTFNFATCMMGTLNHLSHQEQTLALNQMRNCLSPNGIAVASLWNPNCDHLEYLTMYSDSLRRDLRKNLLSPAEASSKMSDAGFIDVSIIPFSLLPGDVLVDLAGDFTNASEMRLPALVDLAILSQYGKQDGEMFLLKGIRK